MRREALTLIFAMFAGTLIMAACEKNPPQPKAAQSSTPPASPAAVPAPPLPLVASSTERRDGQPPIQGQVDSTQPAQQKDFQQSR
ncbi:MAG TPA: hypothetical protein VNM71_08380 [Steroidobacteraceae bacterium]|nr:hypothetical protein [Steroidobacteraceae bacterium]